MHVVRHWGYPGTINKTSNSIDILRSLAKFVIQLPSDVYYQQPLEDAPVHMGWCANRRRQKICA